MDTIITSRLDNDFYNFTMGQLIWKHYPNDVVAYEFINRGETFPLDVSELARQCEALRVLQFEASEINYLRSLGIFEEGYLKYLANEHGLPTFEIMLSSNGNLRIKFEGSWKDAIFWETPLLSIISQLGMEIAVKECAGGLAEDAQERLEAKIELLKDNPDVKIIEFGSRRRFSVDWHEYVLSRLVQCLPQQLIGTSNVWLAMKNGIKPSGTMAHQLFMVTAAKHKALSTSHTPSYLLTSADEVLTHFEELYGSHREMLIYLPDTYTPEIGLKVFNLPRVYTWLGLRQDSGNTFEEINKFLDFYAEYDADTSWRSIVPSNGLSVRQAVNVHRELGKHVLMPFGIGTNLTNDTLIKALNIVVKPSSVNGLPCVKLSSTPEKATGNPAEVHAYQAEVDRCLRGY